jgi:hypothetical protein
VACTTTCWPCFFGHSWTSWLGFAKYKQRLFIHQCCFFYSMRGLNCVLSICMGSSFGKVAKDWGGMIVEKFHCVIGVSSQHLSCQHSKSLLSYRTTCTMAWLKVERFGTVNSKSFTLLHSPNWNLLVNATSSHEISQANYLKSNAYIVAKHDPWPKYHNLVVSRRQKTIRTKAI